MQIISGARLAHNKRHKLAEGPIFNRMDGNFYYVDIDGQELCRYNPNTGIVTSWFLPDKVCGVAPNHDGSLIVARQSGLYYFNPNANSSNSGGWLRVAEIEPEHPENRPNDVTTIECSDGKVRLFIGTMPLNNEPLAGGIRPGALYVLMDDMKLKKLDISLTSGRNIGLVTTNGLAGFTRAETGVTTIFFSDSHNTASKIYKADFNCRSCDLKNVEEFIDMKQRKGRPDGGGLLMMKASSGQWNLCYGITAIDTNEIIIYASDSRQQTAKIRLPEEVSKPTKFASGTTANGRDVCLVTSLNPQRGKPLDGCVFLCDLSESFRAVPSAICTYPSFQEMKAQYPHSERHATLPKNNRLRGQDI